MVKDYDYQEMARESAKDMAKEFLDEIVENMLDTKDTSANYGDYSGGDSYHHESNVDRDYSLVEAANLLEQLWRHEEDDSGLWQGLEPVRAVRAQAAYTYGNAVAAYFRELIEELNGDEELGKLLNPEPPEPPTSQGCTPTRDLDENDEPEIDSEAVKSRIVAIIDEF